LFCTLQHEPEWREALAKEGQRNREHNTKASDSPHLVPLLLLTIGASPYPCPALVMFLLSAPISVFLILLPALQMYSHLYKTDGALVGAYQRIDIPILREFEQYNYVLFTGG
jgi:hypothetical protein